MKDIRKVIIPVAGWGTRSLPATKNIPKEMLPIYNKPVIQYVVEEAQKANIQDVIFVTNRDKSVIEDHFDYNLQLESVLERAGKLEKLAEVRKVAEMVNIMSVRQKKQLGLGHAVLCARELVRGDPFAVMVGDGDQDFLARLIMGGEGGLAGADRQRHVAADEVEAGVAHQRAGQQPRFGQHLAFAGLLEQGGAQPSLQPAQAAADRGRIHPHLRGRARELPCPRDSEEGLIVAPVDPVHVSRSPA